MCKMFCFDEFNSSNFYFMLLFSCANKHVSQKETHRLRKWTYDYWGVETARDFGKVMYTLLYLKWKTNKDLLCTTWNSAQSYMPDWMEGRFGGEWIHVYVFFLILIGGWFQYCRDFCHTLTWISQCTGYMYIHGWVPSLFTWNYHNIVNQIDFNTKGFLVLKS